jgi:hypothetical protein
MDYTLLYLKSLFETNIFILGCDFEVRDKNYPGEISQNTGTPLSPAWVWFWKVVALGLARFFCLFFQGWKSLCNF